MPTAGRVTAGSQNRGSGRIREDTQGHDEAGDQFRRTLEESQGYERSGLPL